MINLYRSSPLINTLDDALRRCCGKAHVLSVDLSDSVKNGTDVMQPAHPIEWYSLQCACSRGDSRLQKLLMPQSEQFANRSRFRLPRCRFLLIIQGMAMINNPDSSRHLHLGQTDEGHRPPTASG